jgi:DNA-binding beta-propeller fold protein YncE
MAGANTYAVKVMDTNGAISILAGNGANGYSDGIGSYARLSQYVWHLFLCSSSGVDIIYIADSNNNLIRAMTTAGLVTTIAGGGGLGNAQGSTDAVGTYAGFRNPIGVACDSSNGDVWVVDTYNYIIRKIAYGTKAVTTVAGQLGTSGSVIDGIGTNARFDFMRHMTYNPNNRCFYVVDSDNSVIRQITTSGEVSTFAGTGSNAVFLDGIGTFATFNAPSGIAFDPTNGNIVVGDYGNHRIAIIDPATAQVITVAGTGVPFAFSNGVGTYAQVIIHPRMLFNHETFPSAADRIRSNKITFCFVFVFAFIFLNYF